MSGMLRSEGNTLLRHLIVSVMFTLRRTMLMTEINGKSVALLLCGVWLAGCGGDARPAPAPEPLPDEAFVDRFCTQYLAAQCQAIVDCYPSFALTTVAECVADRADCVSELRALSVGVAAGRLAYDDTAAQACFQAQGPSCGRVDCNSKAFTGRVAPGGRCYLGYECAGGLCRTDGTQALFVAGKTDCPGAPGTCVGYAGIGAKCSTGLVGLVGPVVDGPLCDPSVAYCDRTCVAFTAGGSCGPGQVCIEGSYCAAVGVASSPTCRPLGGEGAPCTGGGNPECAAGFGCQDNTTNSLDGGRCGLRRPAGGSCIAANGDQCEQGLTCQGSDPAAGVLGVCGPLGARGEGCRWNEECGLGLYCDTASHACADRPRLGGVCYNGGVPPFPTCFGEGLVCIAPPAQGGTCGMYAALGEPCSPSCMNEMNCFVNSTDPQQPCAAGLWCGDGVCKTATAPACPPT